MQQYKDFRPTGFDPKGLALDDKQDWLVLPTKRNRDSGCRDESNFDAALKIVGGEGDDCEVHRFGHWACGWFEIIIVKPNTDAAKKAGEVECALASYPVLDDMDLSERENEQAIKVWRDCYTDAARLEYIRRHRHYFSFGSFEELIRNVRGKAFCGDCSSLVGD